MTDPKPLADLLDTLSNAPTLLAEPGDRAAAARLAQALRDRWAGTVPVRVVLVAGPDADPMGQWLETLRRTVADSREDLAGIEGQLEALVDEARRRRQRVAGERDACQTAALRAARAWTASPQASASGDFHMAMAALRALVDPDYREASDGG